MDVVHERCPGIDISKRDAKVCVRIRGSGRGRATSTVTTWSSMTNQVLKLRDHLVAEQVTLVVMEAMAASTPALVPRCGGVMEHLQDGINGLVFEPNDEPLWEKIRLDVGTFMNDLFRQGAFEGATPAEAYHVRCDHSTTTQSDIDHGIVNISVGFAPLKPAEFVVVQISQIANG